MKNSLVKEWVHLGAHNKKIFGTPPPSLVALCFLQVGCMTVHVLDASGLAASVLNHPGTLVASSFWESRYLDPSQLPPRAGRCRPKTRKSGHDGGASRTGPVLPTWHQTATVLTSMYGEPDRVAQKRPTNSGPKWISWRRGGGSGIESFSPLLLMSKGVWGGASSF